MGEYSIKNYREQNGDVTHIGGSVYFDKGSQLRINTESPLLPSFPESEAETFEEMRTDYLNFIRFLKNNNIL